MDDLEVEKYSTEQLRKLAYSITYSCFGGFALGEATGLVAGTIWELALVRTILISNIVSFLFGFIFALFPLLRINISFGKAFSESLQTTFISFIVYEIVTRTLFYIIPGAMQANITSMLFWKVLGISVLVGFFLSLPINISRISQKEFGYKYKE